MMSIDRLVEKTARTKCPVCIGLDTLYDYVPESIRQDKAYLDPLRHAADCIYKYNMEIIDAVCDIVPAVKVQAAFYEMYGLEGMRVFSDTLKYARMRDLLVIADVKRNDIGSSAAAYASAYLQGVAIDNRFSVGFDSDFITVNPYLGSDGIKPFVDACEKTGKGIFCLVKTSNPSSGEFQDIEVDGKKFYEIVAEKVSEWGKYSIGRNGYSGIGAVVAATYPKQAEKLRKEYPRMYFLVPGFGAQGATAEDIAVNFDKNGFGAVVNSSRAILLAYRNERYRHLDFVTAARQAVLDMRKSILEALESRGIKY
jgi:orotidine-5'-phosphate decarboxylase